MDNNKAVNKTEKKDGLIEVQSEALDFLDEEEPITTYKL